MGRPIAQYSADETSFIGGLFVMPSLCRAALRFHGSTLLGKNKMKFLKHTYAFQLTQWLP